MKNPAAHIQAIAAIALGLTAQTAFGQVTNAAARVIQLPEITVTDKAPVRPGWLKEEQFVGPYNQPEWTTARRFARTRVYIQKLPGEMGVEQWARFRHNQDGSSKTRLQEEFEIGLPHRFQLDFYYNWTIDQNRRVEHDKISGEIRYALADWGVIPLNPTLYFEYSKVGHGDPDAVEAKILLGDEIAPRWHWGLNLICEQELRGAETTEYAVSQGISYSLRDGKLGVGVEMQYSHEIAETSENKFLIGPSIQWRPTSRWHVDFTPLFGVTADAPKLEAYLVIGFDFGKVGGHYAPSSLKTH